MNILFCSSEVVPFAKTGGLADVAAALPLALKRRGHKVKITLPKYKMVKEENNTASIGEDIKVHFIQNDKLYMRDGLYGDESGDYSDNLERFVFYCRQTLELVKSQGFKPDIIHCNDWQTGLIPVYLKTLYSQDEFFKGTKTVFTIHNLAYSGAFPKEEFSKTGLPDSLFSVEGLEFYGKFSLLKGGLVFSDVLTTVSPTYAREIQTEEFGCGMEGILKERTKDLHGILNGIDYDIWDPAKNNSIYKNYSSESLSDKYINKEGLISELGIELAKDVPLVGSVGRLAFQKGYDLLAEIIDELCKMNIPIILLGTGDKKYHDIFEKIAQRHKNKLSINLYFDAALAQKIYAGSDIFLMPSRYEPCGLGQMISFKYGTVPLARKTGGLADTIVEYDSQNKQGNGFLFKEANASALLGAIKKAIDAYSDKNKWQSLIRRCMQYDFSWDRSAKEYNEVYEGLLQ